MLTPAIQKRLDEYAHPPDYQQDKRRVYKFTEFWIGERYSDDRWDDYLADGDTLADAIAEADKIAATKGNELVEVIASVSFVRCKWAPLRIYSNGDRDGGDWEFTDVESAVVYRIPGKAKP